MLEHYTRFLGCYMLDYLVAKRTKFLWIWLRYKSPR